VRIRKEGENLIFGYKGPRGDDGKKCKLEFEIDEETKNLLTQHYGKIAKTISKKRDIFSLKGVIFSLDRIKQTEGEKNFIEIRLPDGKEANIEEFYQKL
jgi:adenylate cyclase class IV